MSLQLLTLMIASAGMALVALSHNAFPVYFMFAALTAVLLVSYVTSRFSPRALVCRREVADRVFENEPITITVELFNRGRLPRFLVTVRDRLPRFLESDQALSFVLPALWPAEGTSLSYEARARKRGVYPLGPLGVSVSDPFGMFLRYARVETRGEAIVYPRPLPLDGRLGTTGLEARSRTTGEHSRASESGLDFYGIRDYQPGDELRRIHWPATAHHGQLTVIEFDRGASVNLAVVLDTRVGTEFGRGVDTTLEVGVRAAASLIHWALRSNGLAFFAADSAQGPRCLGVDHLDAEYEILEVLARVKSDGGMPASALLDWAAPRLPSGAAIFVITATPDDELPSVIASLRYGQLRTAVLVLDAHSFDSRAGHPTAMIGVLEAAGAATVEIRRDDDLQEALGSALVVGD